MAYVSQANISKELGRGRGSKTPSISFRMTKSGSTGCRVTKVTGLYSESIDIQIDEEESKLRIGKVDGAYNVSDQGTFSVSKRVLRMVAKGSDVSVRVELSKADDGWWYGSFADGGSHG